MRVLRLTTVSAAFGLICAAVLPALADDDPAHNLTVGLGVGITPEYEGADEYRPFPVVPLRYEHPWVTIQVIGLGLEFDISPTEYLQAGPTFQYKFARDSDVDDPIVRLLPQVDAALELGAFVRSGIPLNMVGFDDPAIIFGQVTARHDVLDGHGGFLAEGSLGVTRPIGDRLNAIVFAKTTYASDDYMSAYYDVTAAGSAASGLAVFDADSGFKDVGVTGLLNFKVTEKWSATALGSYSRLIGDAASSPVVAVAGSRDQFTAGVAISYKLF